MECVKTHKQIHDEIKRVRAKDGIRAMKRLAFLSVLLVQLRNGSRISEALDGVRLWADTGKVELEVRVRKTVLKKNMVGDWEKKAKKRDIVIPKELDRLDKAKIKGVIDGVSSEKVSVFAIQVFKWNSHSLRYAFVSYLSKKGVAPQLIAKITR